VTDPKVFFSLPDNGGRRSGIDRRKFSYSAHIPERRHGLDRRSGRDRRDLMDLSERRTRNKVPATRRKTGQSMERRLALRTLPGMPQRP
jgi:hypothetical protein